MFIAREYENHNIVGGNEMEKALVSVLLVTYNRANYIRQTIESVLNQTYKNIQLIIVDDGSVDESHRVIESIKDDRIEYYELKENRHICYATNYGFEKVKGQYLARIDSDDVWYPNKLEEQLKFMETHKNCDVCFTGVHFIDKDGNDITEKEQLLYQLFQIKFSSQEAALRHFFFEGNCLSHPSVFMKTEVMRKTGEFNPSYVQLHDFDYWVRIAKHHPIYVMDKCLVKMRRFESGDAEQNNSNMIDQSNFVRFYNEFSDIRRHFFDDLKDDIFVKTFAKDFRNRTASSKEELECEKAFLLCSPLPSSTWTSAVGVERFFEIMLRPEIRKVLEDKYHFVEKTMYELTKEHIYKDYVLDSQICQMHQRIEECNVKFAEIEQKIHELEVIICNKDKEIASYRDSTCWKITAPVRRFLDFLR